MNLNEVDYVNVSDKEKSMMKRCV